MTNHERLNSHTMNCLCKCIFCYRSHKMSNKNSMLKYAITESLRQFTLIKLNFHNQSSFPQKCINTKQQSRQVVVYCTISPRPSSLLAYTLWGEFKCLSFSMNFKVFRKMIGPRKSFITYFALVWLNS